MIISREEYINELLKFLNKEEVKIITGVRRSGKTFLLKMFIDKLKEKGISSQNIIYMNFESAFYDHIKDYKDLNEFIFNKLANVEEKVYLLFDEIQLVSDWQKSINAFRVDLDSDIYITGSNSKLFAGEFATLLSGRYKQINVYPLTFKELLNSREILSRYDEIELFNEYLTYGGFPRVLSYDEDDKNSYLDDIYHSIVIKDIISRNNVKNVDMLQRLLKFTISHIGKTFSARSLQTYLKHENITLTPPTIANYLNHAINAFILIKVPREDLKVKKLLTISEKYYVIDSGFYNIQTGIIKSKSQLLENIVLLQLLYKGYEVHIGRIKDLEIDFVGRKANETIYVQVSQSIINEKTLEREFKPLEMVKDNYKKYIITLDDFDYSRSGIIHMNIIDFLKLDKL